MTKKESFENKIIDEFYGEENLNSQDVDSHIKQAFEDKLNSSLSKMDKLDEMDFDLDVNILSIINKADEIKENKTSKLEVVKFLSVCISIILISALLVFKFGTELIIYAEILFSFILPLSLIPFWRFAKAKGDTK